MPFIFKIPSHQEFTEVCELIKEYRLDDRDFKKEEFTIALQNNKLMAFGRLRKHTDCLELCSIGVLKTSRSKGIGTELVKHIINNDFPIYVVSIIPDFFARFHFKLTSNYPSSIKQKINYCTQQLVVPEEYVAMVLDNNDR
jgi:N-acetylglutamate synthase-like GNAT family acetyltransferase